MGARAAGRRAAAGAARGGVVVGLGVLLTGRGRLCVCVCVCVGGCGGDWTMMIIMGCRLDRGAAKHTDARPWAAPPRAMRSAPSRLAGADGAAVVLPILARGDSAWGKDLANSCLPSLQWVARPHATCAHAPQPRPPGPRPTPAQRQRGSMARWRWGGGGVERVGLGNRKGKYQLGTTKGTGSCSAREPNETRDTSRPPRKPQIF